MSTLAAFTAILRTASDFKPFALPLSSKLSAANLRISSAFTPSVRLFSSKFFTSSLSAHPLFKLPHSTPDPKLTVSVLHAAHDPKPTVLVAVVLGEDELALLKSFAIVDCFYNLTPEELCAKIPRYDALIVGSDTMVSREVFESSAGRLKVVGRVGVVIDNVDLAAATMFGCLVVNEPTSNTVAAAEHTIALLTDTARSVAQADASVKAGKWEERDKYVGVSLAGKTLAVMGFGKVGSEVARRAKGLGMNVIAHDPYADWAHAMGVDLVGFDEAIATADFISLHIPLTPSTSKILNHNAFAKMKKGVRIVNVGSGGVIDEEALLKALDTGIVAQVSLVMQQRREDSNETNKNILASRTCVGRDRKIKDQVTPLS